MTVSFILIVSGILLSAVAALPMLLLGPSQQSQKLSIAVQTIAGMAGLTGAMLTLINGNKSTWSIIWGLPFGALEIGIDPLSALFLLPIFLIATCCSIYSANYWPADELPDTAPRLTLYFSILTASLAVIVIARHAVLFLIAWEIMAISCYFAMTIDSRKKEVREAGILYLVTAHIGTLALFTYFAQLKSICGFFTFPAVGSIQGTAAISASVFLAAVIGFGMKAGLMPLHIWLPSAHANAPSHISALMSGVLIKIGIYGLLRTISFFYDIPFWWGGLILVTGIISGVVGVVFAIGQHDIKRLLAYHSIENIGIIAMGTGIALMGISNGIHALVILGMAGALLHTLNHAIFKSLLFLGAGSVIHACGTREIDRMGGLIKRMPLTSAFFLVGAVAICGLPPLNGFVSELLIYLGLFRGIIDTDTLNDPYFALAAPSLALIGGLATACFVKVFGIAFLGAARTEQAVPLHEAGRAMLFPMALLASLCLFIGVFPQLVAPLLETTIYSIFPILAEKRVRLAEFSSLGMVSCAALLFILLIGVAAFIYQRRLAGSKVTTAETWGCGYLAPNPRMQYTSSSFAASLVALFSGVLRPHTKLPVILGYFPKAASFRNHVPETVLEKIYLPLFMRLNDSLSLLRRLQHGKLHIYILYIVITLLLLLSWSHFRLRS